MTKPKKCQRAVCNSDRILTIGARAKDMHYYDILGESCDQNYGAVFSSDGDTTEITLCLQCGQVQHEFPHPLMFMEPGYSDLDAPTDRGSS